MSYFYQNHAVVPPVGTIIQYIGKTDPDGWLICNGVMRTDPDGRFAALADVLNDMEKRVLNTMGTAIVNDSNHCTPPDLSGRLLYGKSGSNLIGNITGNKMKTLQANNLPSHDHFVNDDGHNHGGRTEEHKHLYSEDPHSHTYYDPGHTHTYNYRKAEPKMQGTDNFTWKHSSVGTTDNAATNIKINMGYSTGTIEKSNVPIEKKKTNITVDNTGTGSAFNIMPPYFVINYIIKY